MRLFVDQLTNVDFSYLCPARCSARPGSPAYSWLAAWMNRVWFAIWHRQKHLRQWLDDTLDHKLLVPSRAPQLALGDDKCRKLHLCR